MGINSDTNRERKYIKNDIKFGPWTSTKMEQKMIASPLPQCEYNKKDHPFSLIESATGLGGHNYMKAAVENPRERDIHQTTLFMDREGSEKRWSASTHPEVFKLGGAIKCHIGNFIFGKDYGFHF